jgi:5'-nucleotidase/UDP-sugar diphosphatase
MKTRLFFLLFVLFVIVGCGGGTAVSVTPTPQPNNIPANQPTLMPGPESSQPEIITVLYTNDEHGWMEGMRPGTGAAELLGLWQEEEGYSPEDETFIILSGGDMWTGPAISTWFDGEGMAAVMNEMGYDAAAVGNHEFDFGLDMLQVRQAQSEFPFLSANVRYASDNTVPTDLGILPYTIIPANDISVGIIGLTSVSTPRTTNPNNVVDFNFIDYETALREVVPEVQADGADLILVAAHACQSELEGLATAVSDLNIQLFGGGHCNELFAKEHSGAVLMEGGSHLRSYARALFAVDAETDTVEVLEFGTVQNEAGTAVPAVQTIVDTWRVAVDAELNEVIGFAEAGVGQQSPVMRALVTHAWLMGYPNADVAITNSGGFRAPIEPGEITLADIVTVLPFDNVIVEVSLSGEDLLTVLDIARNDAIAGVHFQDSQWLLDSSGQPVDPAGSYSLLVNDFMYAGGDDYALLAEADPNAYNTAIDWRQPVIDWITAQESREATPLDDALAELLE